MTGIMTDNMAEGQHTETGYIVVDLEMTGLRAKEDRILEIGAVKVRDGKWEDTFQTFVNPHRKIRENLVQLTGITQEMVADAPDAGEAFAEFLKFAGDLPLVGHNLIFDYSFLKQCAVNHNYSFERKGIDTLKIARKLLKEPEKKTLESLSAWFGISQNSAHRALDDAKATAELFFLLKRNFFEEEPGLFVPKPLQYKAKKQGLLTPAQKRDLNHLLIYHRIEFDMEIDCLTKSEASRIIDRIYARYGRIPKTEESKNV